MWSRLDERITMAAVKLDHKINVWSLLNMPERRWKTFSRLVYMHFFLATCLFIFGIICFCLGMQFSGMYTEVNCSDGTNIWIPLLNLIASFTGLFTLRTLHLHWPAFVHCVSLWVVLIGNVVSIVDSAFASHRWFGHARDRHTSDHWATNYAYMDLFLALLAATNQVICILIMFLLIKYWCKEQASTE